MTTQNSAPFQLHNSPGEVVASYGVNTDPREVGFGLLGLNMVDVAHGFPVLEARVKYGGAGYKAYMGWIQVLSMRENGNAAREVVDIPPQLENTGAPFMAWGPTPTYFDAPATTATQATWTASAFLVASPDCLMTKTVAPLMAIEWGYSVIDGDVVPAPLIIPKVTQAWSRILPVLRQSFASWQFTDG